MLCCQPPHPALKAILDKSNPAAIGTVRKHSNANQPEKSPKPGKDPPGLQNYRNRLAGFSFCAPVPLQNNTTGGLTCPLFLAKL